MYDDINKKRIISSWIGIIAVALIFFGSMTVLTDYNPRELAYKPEPGHSENQPEENVQESRNPVTKADFALELVNSKGEKVSLEQFKGKVIFLNIWATWCPPCVAEMPGINAMYNDIDRDKIEVIMVSMDRRFQKAIDFKERKKFDFEIYKVRGRVPRMYDAESIPTTYIIDSKGNLVLTQMGMAAYNHQDFKDFLNSL